MVCGGQPGLLRAETRAGGGTGADFKEVYDLVRAHLAGVSEAELNEAAVKGLIASLNPRVKLVTNGTAAKAAGKVPAVKKSSVFEGDSIYVRVGRVEEDLAGALSAACSKPETTNKLKGVVLDLRYAGGDDYAAAAAAADLFLRKEQPLLNWGDGMVRSRAAGDEIELPVAVLVNRQTTGAAEALAAVLRETGVGLILGGQTAGQAMVAREFSLKNGDRLRIATTAIQLGDGSAMTVQGLKPDIVVEVSAEAERAYYGDAYRAPEIAGLPAGSGLSMTNSGTATNRAARRLRLNEAELVRERREGLSEADLTMLRGREPETPTVQDPALARALDLLRGLALVRSTRP